MTRRLTLRREIVNNRLCSCDGFSEVIPVPPGGGRRRRNWWRCTGGGGTGGGGTGGGGGGTGTLLTLYNVSLDTGDFARLALVSNSSSNYLRFGARSDTN